MEQKIARVELSGAELAFRDRLRAEHGISALLMGIPTTARLMGLSSATLYAYIRDGKFFLPLRRVNKTPMVAVDDFARWYCASKEMPDAPESDSGTGDSIRA